MLRHGEYSEELVFRVNELFHDDGEACYGDVHEIHLKVEGDRWRRMAAGFLPESPRVILDIGTGLGMVPLAIGGLLGRADRVIAADISSGMLEVARRNIESGGFPWSAEYMKLTASVPFRLPMESASVDVVTMNSVLHHVKDTASFLAEIDRVLRPGSVLAIAHEPNAVSHQNRLVRWGYVVIEAILSPRRVFKSSLFRALRLEPLLRAIYYRLRPSRGRVARKWIDGMNAQLRAEGLIDRPLEVADVYQITDILHDVGFRPRDILPAYELLQLETYDFVGVVSVQHARLRPLAAYERWLARRFPEHGFTFFASYRKPAVAAERSRV